MTTTSAAASSPAARPAGDPVHPAPTAHRDGLHGYDDLQPELDRYAGLDPDDPDREELRERLVREFLPLVHNLSRRFAGPNQPLEDIQQAGALGLIKAIDRYDPARTSGGALGFLVPSVRGEMLRYLRDHTWAMRVPRDLKELSVSVRRAADTLSQRLGRAPRPSEIAAHVGVPVSEVVDTLGALESYRARSLDAPVTDGEQTVGEQLAAEDDILDLAESRDDLRRAIDRLPARDRKILLLRFYGEQTQSRIAEQVGLSQMHVSRLLARTLQRLRAELSEAADEGGPP